MCPSHTPVGSHPSIVSLLGLTTQGSPTCLLLDYVPNGTLGDFLVSLKLGPIPEWYTKFVRDTLRGAYHKHVSGDLMNIIMQVAEGMVRFQNLKFAVIKCVFLSSSEILD